MWSCCLSLLITATLNITDYSEYYSHHHYQVVRPIHVQWPERVIFLLLSFCIEDKCHLFLLTLAWEQKPPSCVGLLTWHIYFDWMNFISFIETWLNPLMLSFSLTNFDYSICFNVYYSFRVWGRKLIDVFFKIKVRFYGVFKCLNWVIVIILYCNW